MVFGLMSTFWEGVRVFKFELTLKGRRVSGEWS